MITYKFEAICDYEKTHKGRRRRKVQSPIIRYHKLLRCLTYLHMKLNQKQCLKCQYIANSWQCIEQNKPTLVLCMIQCIVRKQHPLFVALDPLPIFVANTRQLLITVFQIMLCVTSNEDSCTHECPQKIPLLYSLLSCILVE